MMPTRHGAPRFGHRSLVADLATLPVVSQAVEAGYATNVGAKLVLDGGCTQQQRELERPLDVDLREKRGNLERE